MALISCAYREEMARAADVSCQIVIASFTVGAGQGTPETSSGVWGILHVAAAEGVLLEGRLSAFIANI
jgi:choline-glycine betaine transporter